MRWDNGTKQFHFADSCGNELNGEDVSCDIGVVKKSTRLRSQFIGRELLGLEIGLTKESLLSAIALQTGAEGGLKYLESRKSLDSARGECTRGLE